VRNEEEWRWKQWKQVVEVEGQSGERRGSVFSIQKSNFFSFSFFISFFFFLLLKRSCSKRGQVVRVDEGKGLGEGTDLCEGRWKGRKVEKKKRKNQKKKKKEKEKEKKKKRRQNQNK